MAPTIGVIDDDEAVRDSIHALLESYGYDVCEFATAEGYLSSSSLSPDCLLVDQHMPGLSGLDLLEQLRRQGDTTPAFIVTGRIDDAIQQRANLMGVRIFSKPILDQDLVAAIEVACGPRPSL